MTKNNFVAQMDEMKHKNYMDGFSMGKELEQMAMAIAMNEVYGFAGDRLKRLEPVLNEIWSDMKTDEPELLAAHLVKRAQQIKGVTVGYPPKEEK